MKKDAFASTRQCNDYLKELVRRLLKERGEMDEEARGLLVVVMNFSSDAIFSLLRYIQALEDYGYELDEEWDKLLKSIEQTREAQPKPIQKEGKKKPSYIK